MSEEENNLGCITRVVGFKCSDGNIYSVRDDAIEHERKLICKKKVRAISDQLRLVGTPTPRIEAFVYFAMNHYDYVSSLPNKKDIVVQIIDCVVD